MTHIRQLMFPLSLAAALTVPMGATAVTVDINDEGSDLASELFLNLPGLTVTDAELFGEFGQAGTYTNVIGTYGLPQNGIVLSSGNVTDYGAGGNSSAGTSTAFGVAASVNQTELLEGITGQSSFFDTVQLNIEFETDADVSQVTFFGAFGSEEFPEFVNSSFNDGFGLFVNGTNVAGVSEFNGSAPLPVNIDHPSFAPVTGTELDGVLAPGGNPVLRFDVPVEPGTTNNFTIILADASDTVLDTTVFISSFIAANPGGGGGTPGAATGVTEFDPLLPIINADGEPVFDENGGFVVDIDATLANTGNTIWVDPPVSVGFTYEIDGGALVTSISAPSLATVADLDGYIVTIGGTDYTIGAGETLIGSMFGSGISSFILTGIDPDLELDPEDTIAFPLGLTFANVTDDFGVTITPITVDGPSVAAVPLPATGFLYLGLLAIGATSLRRRQNSGS